MTTQSADVIVYFANLQPVLDMNSLSLIFIQPELIFYPSFDLYSFVNSMNFDRKFASGRLTKLFGDLSYTYAKITHYPDSFETNIYIQELMRFVELHYSNLHLNSCLINYYPDSDSYIPDHSDDESSIADNSYILTISLGAHRTMHFKRKCDSSTLATATLTNGSVLIFSKNSQQYFTHGIPSSTSTVAGYIPRLSATFRSMIER